MIDTKLQQEIDLLKATFQDNEDLLKLIRSLFFGFDLSDAEKNTIRTTFANPNLREAIRSRMYPILSKDVPVGTEQDFWGGTETQIFNKDQMSIRQAVESKQRVLDTFTQAFKLLENPFDRQIDISYDTSSLAIDPLQIKLLARCLYIKTVSIGLATIKVMVEQKNKETPQETIKRLDADSTK